MHITIDCRMWGKAYGGIGRYTKEIVLWLLQHRDWEFSLLVAKEAYADLWSYVINHQIRLLPFAVPILSIKEQFFLWKQIPECDLFWSPYMNVPFLPCKARKRVVTLHDVFHLANPQYYSTLKRMVIWPYYFFSTRCSDLIVTVSSFSKKEMYRYFGKVVGQKVRYVYNGCNIDVSNVPLISRDYNYFLFVGSVKPHKNLKNALLAFRQLKKHNMKFVIVGKKEGFITADKEVLDLVEKINICENSVFFTGNVNDLELYAWYKGATALIFPSYYEGFGLPIIEAMQFGLPIICSDIPVFREIGKDTLLYFDPSDPMDICKKMTEILLVGRKTYSRWPTWDKTALSIANLFENLMKY